MPTLTTDQQKQWNAKIVDILGKFHEICRENDLRYFCVGGTEIGCVRHKGLIPWDDDIDVCMPRPDYERLLALFSEERYPGYELVSPYNTPGYPIPSLKLCDKRTTLMEDSHIPVVTGLYIDIFALDATADNLGEAHALFDQYVKLKNRLNAISYHTSLGEHLALLLQPGQWGRFVYKTIGYLAPQSYRRHILRKLRAISLKYSYEEARHVVIYCGSYGRREVYPKAWIDELVEMPFENIKVLMPTGYDAHLRQIFGDYMQLPPEEQRVAKHSKAYFNMDQRESVEAVKRKVKANEQ